MRYIIFIEHKNIRKEQKYKSFEVINRLNDRSFGKIKWNSSWKQYAFYPSNLSYFSKGCLKEIECYIEKVMEERDLF